MPFVPKRRPRKPAPLHPNYVDSQEEENDDGDSVDSSVAAREQQLQRRDQEAAELRQLRRDDELLSRGNANKLAQQHLDESSSGEDEGEGDEEYATSSDDDDEEDVVAGSSSSAGDEGDDEEGDDEENEDDDSSDDDDDSSDDDSSDPGYGNRTGASAKSRRRRRAKNSASAEAKITRKVREILDDETKAAEVRKQLDAVLAQADLYAEFLRQQVEAAALDEGSGGDDSRIELLEPPEGCGLLAHQVYGVRWLTSVFSNGINAILSDEQGLGKTIEVIGFLARIFSERIVGPHIIVVPLSTIDNWRREFARWAPGIRVLVLHGARDDYPLLLHRVATELRPPYSNEEKMRYRSAKELAAVCGGVVITSYEVAMRHCDALNDMPKRWRAACKDAHRADVMAWRRDRELRQIALQEGRKRQAQAATTTPATGEQEGGAAAPADDGSGNGTGGGCFLFFDTPSSNARTLSSCADGQDVIADGDPQRVQDGELQREAQEEPRPMPEIDSDDALLSRTWGVLVVDEAHRLKNFQCLLIQELRALTCESRLLLTGTPMHNRLTELWSILHFIVPELFQSVVNFRVWFGVSDELVRTTCSFTDQVKRREEAAARQQQQQQQQQQDPESAGAGGDVDDEEGGQLVLLERTEDEDFDGLIRNAVAAARESTKPKPKPKAKGKRGAAAAAASATSAESETAASDPADATTTLPTSARASALTTNDGLNRPATPVRAMKFESMTAHQDGAAPLVKQLGQEESVGVVAKMHRVLRPFMLRRTKNELPELNLPRKTEVLVRCPLSELQKRAYQAALTGGNYRTARLPHLRAACNHPYMMGNKCEFERFVADIRRCKGDVQTFCGNKELRASYVSHLLEDSTKTRVVLNLLPILAAQGHVTLVFSQSVMMLDAVAELLDAYAKGELRLGPGGCHSADAVPLLYRRLHGGQSIEDRNEQLNDFMDESKNVAVYLVSTRAGGVGLNLMRADTVIMLDPDFNPHNDMQAIDRCHRIGQRRPVVVYRLYCQRTVEEVILECCTHKLRLEGLVIGAGRYKGVADSTSTHPSNDKADQQQQPGGAVAADDEQRRLVALRKREAEAIRSALGRLRTMVLADFSIDRDAANQGSPGGAAADVAAPSGEVFDDGELLTYVPSSVGGAGHFVFNVDEQDPTWGLDLLVANVPRE